MPDSGLFSAEYHDIVLTPLGVLCDVQKDRSSSGACNGFSMNLHISALLLTHRDQSFTLSESECLLEQLIVPNACRSTLCEWR